MALTTKIVRFPANFLLLSNDLIDQANLVILQMSNVVETCLNFIRSSFRMSKTDESNSAQPKHNQNAQSSNTTTHSGYSVKTKKSQETPNLYNLPYVSSLQSNKPVKPQVVNWFLLALFIKFSKEMF